MTSEMFYTEECIMTPEEMFCKGGDYPHEYDDMAVETLQEEHTRMVSDLKGLYEKQRDAKEPIVDADGISIDVDIIALDHDVQLLEAYIEYRIKKNEV